MKIAVLLLQPWIKQIMSGIIIFVVIVIASLIVCFFFRSNQHLHYRCHMLEKLLVESDQAVPGIDSERDEIFQIILDNISCCVLVKDIDNGGRHIIWNKELERHTGVTSEEIIGKSGLEVEPWPGMNSLIQTLDEQAIRKGALLQETLCETRSGKRIFYRTDKRAIKTNCGRTLILDMCRDITEEMELRNRNTEIIDKQRRLLDRYEIIYDCINRLTNRPRNREEVDWGEIFTYILSQFGKEENASHVYIYYLSQPDHTFFEHAYEWNNERSRSIPEALKKIPFGILPKTKEAFQERRVRMIDIGELAQEPYSFFKEWLQGEQIGFAIFSPLIYRGEVIGLLGFDYRELQKEFADTSHHVVFNAAKMVELAYACYRDDLESGNGP